MQLDSHPYVHFITIVNVSIVGKQHVDVQVSDNLI